MNEEEILGLALERSMERDDASMSPTSLSSFQLGSPLDRRVDQMKNQVCKLSDGFA